MSLKLLGLMRKANAIAPGTDRAHEAIQSGRAKLLILPEDAPERALKDARYFLQGHRTLEISVPYSASELGSAIGLGSCSMIAVTDIGFAEAFVKTLGEGAAETAQELARRKEKLARRKNKKKG